MLILNYIAYLNLERVYYQLVSRILLSEYCGVSFFRIPVTISCTSSCFLNYNSFLSLNVYGSVNKYIFQVNSFSITYIIFRKTEFMALILKKMKKRLGMKKINQKKHLKKVQKMQKIMKLLKFYLTSLMNQMTNVLESKFFFFIFGIFIL